MLMTFIADRYDLRRSPITFHRSLQEWQRSFAIPAQRPRNLEHLALVVNRTPEIVRLTIDPDEDFVQVPAPL